jgi:hypothetical protein
MVNVRKSAALALALAAACGDDGISGFPDASLDDGSTPDVHDVSTEFDDPSDFDPLGCVPGSMAGLDPVGIWHQDVNLAEFGSFPSAIRIDDDGGALVARVNARDTPDVTLTDDHLFVRLSYETGGGDRRVRAFYACAAADADHLSGKVAFCQGGGCITGTFVDARIHRAAGEGDAQGITLLGEYAGPAADPWPHDDTSITVNVRVVDGVAYLARYRDGLRLVDVGDPAAPSELGWSPTALPEQFEIYNDVKIVDGPTGRRYALMASSDRGVVVVDVTDPASPVERGTFPPIDPIQGRVGVHTLFVEGTRAYLANTSTIGLDVYDVTDPEQPQPLGAFVHPDVAVDFSAYLHDLYVEGGVAYLDYWGLGLVVVDANDPGDIVEIGRYDDYERRTNHSSWVTTAGGRRVAVTGDEDWNAHARIVDVDPASPTYMQRIGELELREEISIHNIMAFGDRAYIAWYQDGVRIVDLSDPTQPSIVGYLNTWDGRDGNSFYEAAIGIDVDPAQGLIYVADTARGLLIAREDL